MTPSATGDALQPLRWTQTFAKPVRLDDLERVLTRAPSQLKAA